MIRFHTSGSDVNRSYLFRLPFQNQASEMRFPNFRNSLWGNVKADILPLGEDTAGMGRRHKPATTEIGRLIDDHLGGKGFKHFQRELKDAACIVSERAIHNWRSGGNSPEAEHRLALSSVLGRTLTDINAICDVRSQASGEIYIPLRSLELATIYYQHFSKISKHVKPGGPNVLAALFFIEAALIEINDIMATPLRAKDIAVRVMDTAFRGQPHDVYTCLDLMQNAGFVTVVGEQASSPEDTVYLTTLSYAEFVRTYIQDVCSRCLETALNLEDHNWLPAARAFYDYYVYSYVPHWYLFLSSVLTKSAARDSVR
jgi:hypothetical protein